MIEIFDDLIPEHLVDFYEMSILGRGNNQERSINATVDFRCRYEGTAFENDRYPLSFVHVLKSSTHLSSHLENFGLIPSLVCEEKSLILRDIAVARIYLILPYDTKLDHYAPHIDLPFEHKVVLYYVNDSDGDTVFFNQGKIFKRVAPKRGRCVVFDGDIWHGGGIPTKNPRSVVNFDILVGKL